VRIVIVLLLVATGPFASRAADAGLANLFPAETALFVECARPGQLAQHLGELIKGSTLENALPAIDKMREKFTPGSYIETSAAGGLGIMFSPEMLAESARFKGAAFGISRFNKLGEPEWAAVILTGDSHAAGLLMRGFLSTSVDVRKVATVERVDLYQESRGEFIEDPLLGGRGDVQRSVRTSGPLFGYRPGMIVFASSKEAATDLIRRHGENEKSASLVSHAGFQSFDGFRSGADLFAYFDIKAMLKAMPQRDAEAQTAIAALDKIAAPQALAVRLNFSGSDIELEARLRLDGKVTSPLSEFLTAPIGVSPALKWVQPGTNVLMLNLPEKDRLPRLRALLDPIVKATGTLGPDASELLEDLDRRKIIARADLAKIERLVLVMENPAMLPLLLVLAEDDTALSAIEAAIPAVLEANGGQKTEPLTETVEGIKIRSLDKSATGMNVPMHYGRKPGCLAIGSDRKQLATILNRESKPSPIARDIEKYPQPGLLAALHWSTLLPAEMPPPKKAPAARPDLRQSPPVEMSAELRKSIHDLPPLLLVLRRDRQDLHVAIRQPLPAEARIALLNGGFDLVVRNAARTIQRSREFDTPIIEQRLLPPLP